MTRAEKIDALKRACGGRASETCNMDIGCPMQLRTAETRCLAFAQRTDEELDRAMRRMGNG